jgi:uncharacterized protein (DUF488 family)
MDLYTVGHSNHPIDKFTQLLIEHAISRLVDVRSNPYSRFNPQFNHTGLRQTLLDLGIDYIYLGKELGGRPADPSCYKLHTLPTKTSDFLHEIDYNQVMQRPWYIQGIRRLLELADEQLTCVLCSEKDPACCHRHHLIASYLLVHHPEVLVRHILADGSEIEARSMHSASGSTLAVQLSF